MRIELHILQNFAPSNLNRDDTGAPKDCEFGGYRRARISSQCLKRAIRDHFRDNLASNLLSTRTKRLFVSVAQRLDGQGLELETIQDVVEVLLKGAGIKFDEQKRLPSYLLFLSSNEMDSIAHICREHWDVLADLAVKARSQSDDGDQESARTRGRGRTPGRTPKDGVPKVALEALHEALEHGRSADLALFGRMIADVPGWNVEAACQVAHAISTHKVSTEFDYFTAVDDLQQEDTTGAGMLGTVQFNSACFYRYTNLDVEQLKTNLDDDVSLARDTVAALLRATIEAIPTGKQNSMAAQNMPSFILAVVREDGPWSLTNAFVKPVRPTEQSDLIDGSVRKLVEHWNNLAGMYGTSGIRDAWVSSLETYTGVPIDAKSGTVNQLIQGIIAATFGSEAAA